MSLSQSGHHSRVDACSTLGTHPSRSAFQPPFYRPLRPSSISLFKGQGQDKAFLCLVWILFLGSAEDGTQALVSHTPAVTPCPRIPFLCSVVSHTPAVTPGPRIPFSVQL